MPTYEYACRACGARFEAWQKITDDPIETCPTCGAPVHRVLYPVGVVFKGGGFYKTDSRGVSSASEAAGDTSGETKVASSESKESAPASAHSPSDAGAANTSKPLAAASGE